MAATTELLTVDAFRKLPEARGEFYYELRHGEMVKVTRPRLRHLVVQRTLRQMLEGVAPAGSLVERELAFRPLPEHELRVADVAYVPPERWRNVDLDDYFQGTPDLVIEVLPPSHTAAELNEKEKLCLETGAREFWVVDPDLRQVRVSTPDGHSMTWRAGQELPLPLLGGARIQVDAIFV
jgi:Uma2 family endonuclease